MESARWPWCSDYITDSRTCVADVQSSESHWQASWLLCRRCHWWQGCSSTLTHEHFVFLKPWKVASEVINFDCTGTARLVIIHHFSLGHTMYHILLLFNHMLLFFYFCEQAVLAELSQCILCQKHVIYFLAKVWKNLYNSRYISYLKVCLTLKAWTLLHCTLSLLAQYIVNGPVSGFVCLCVCGSVTTITRNCMHRSSPNWVYR